MFVHQSPGIPHNFFVPHRFHIELREMSEMNSLNDSVTIIDDNSIKLHEEYLSPKEELADFELPKYAIQGFVIDYFAFRLLKEGYDWDNKPELPYPELPQYHMMRAMAVIFERKHEAELNEMVAELMQDKFVTYRRYVKVVEEFASNEDESPAQMSYGRLVALISFGGLVATHLARQSEYDEVSLVATFTSKFLEQRIQQTWASDNRSWEKFTELANLIIARDMVKQNQKELGRRIDQRWSLVAAVGFGFVGICAFVLWRFYHFR
ncbi:hypothetical protein AB6A40_007382 [Gnathostoma spinigerum]|uniref:Apoptosis regulator Bcl-2 family BH4 domain-containing protein n=1 Tax=Gnathostoma spinigerum TaxID=75299 RepID=A0ABD6ELB9_9BILA